MYKTRDNLIFGFHGCDETLITVKVERAPFCWGKNANYGNKLY